MISKKFASTITVACVTIVVICLAVIIFLSIAKITSIDFYFSSSWLNNFQDMVSMVYKFSPMLYMFSAAAIVLTGESTKPENNSTTTSNKLKFDVFSELLLPGHITLFCFLIFSNAKNVEYILSENRWHYYGKSRQLIEVFEDSMGREEVWNNILYSSIFNAILQSITAWSWLKIIRIINYKSPSL